MKRKFIMFKKVLVVVLDSFGIGALPDAANYGDAGAATLQHLSLIHI